MWGVEDEFTAGEILHGENLPRSWKIPEGELLRGNFILGDFDGIPIRNFYICLAFSLLT